MSGWIWLVTSNERTRNENLERHKRNPPAVCKNGNSAHWNSRLLS